MSRLKRFAVVGVLASLVMSVLTVSPVVASAASVRAVPGLYHCAASSTCDIVNARLNFRNYSSVCFVQDCNFVAAADWEKVVLGLDSSVSTLKGDYANAGQTFNGGLNMSQLWPYWRTKGIDGATATNVTPYLHSRVSVQNGVLDFGAVVAELVTKNNWYIGTTRYGSGTAILIVDGFDPKGPLVVYQAQTLQMTWAQWSAEARGMWGITATTVPPSTTTTTTTTPVTTTTTTSTTTTTVPAIPASDYGPQGQTYQTYGNVYPANLGDCTFAGAANWEQIILGANPDPTVIGYEFSQAGGSATYGLSISALFNYWYQYGIAGYYLHGYDSYYTSQVDVENGVVDYGAMVAVLQFVSGDYIGNQQVNAGGHVVVVDGYTPEGPLVVTWGTTIQMSWQQWNAEVTGMYGINASTTPN